MKRTRQARISTGNFIKIRNSEYFNKLFLTARQVIISAIFASSVALTATGYDELDCGAPVSKAAKAQLFNQVIFSEYGIGIGLYQFGQLVKRTDCQRLLESNNQSNV